MTNFFFLSMQVSFSLSLSLSLNSSMAEQRNLIQSTMKSHREATASSPVASCSCIDHLAHAAVAYRRVPTTTVGDRRPEEIVESFEKCAKLKIDQKKCWAWKLNDIISKVVKFQPENDEETNFLKASRALEVGVRIYSARVDSLHSETYRVLSGLNRARVENERVMDDNHPNNCIESDEQESEKKISPLTTLASSFEALNLKKFDVACAVEPLNHRKFALVNEGGATGLLLNNLGVYGWCWVLFDSLEVPGNIKPRSEQNEVLAFIDLSFAKESIEQMMKNMSTENEICPTLGEINCLLDKDNQSSRQPMNVDLFQTEVDIDNSFDNHGVWLVDHEDEDATFESHQENESNTCEPVMDDRFEKVPMFLLEHFGFTSQQNAWAGPDHWKYRNPKEIISTSESMTTFSTRRNKETKVAAADLQFASLIGKEVPSIFSPPRDTKFLLLPPSRLPRSNLLPEDCHYELKDLVKLFLLPNIQCLGPQLQKHPGGNSWEENNYFDEALPSWDKESGFNGEFDNGDVVHDFEDSEGLIFQRPQVNEIVQYEKASRQIDVNILKEALWDQMQEVSKVPEMDSNDLISFKHLLASFPVDCHQDEAPEEFSPHLLFVCLLHLANDRGLVIHDCPSLDDLTIYLPSCEDIASF